MSDTAFVCGHSDYTIKWASLPWEVEQALALRRRVFCLEQALFDLDDRDPVDDIAQCLVAVANYGGWPDQVVGTVRIHQYSDGVWWGSRLAVDQAFRHRTGIGAALIRLAVCSANALGCNQFLAQVQKQNEPLFNRLNWRSHYDLQVRHRPHVMMEAELSQYPPCFTPYSGFVVKGRPAPVPEEMAPALLAQNVSSITVVNSHVAH